MRNGKRDEAILVLVDEDTKTAIRIAAAADGKSLSKFAYDVLSTSEKVIRGRRMAKMV